MSQHNPEDQPSPWPTREEGEAFMSLLREAGVQITEYQNPTMIQVKHPDGRSLWATRLDIRPGENLQFAPHVFPPSLIYPVIAETQDGLRDRISAVVREARTYNMHPQPRSPMRRNPHEEADIKALEECVAARSRRSHDE